MDNNPKIVEKKLDLGGIGKNGEWTTINIVEPCDIVHDLNSFPYPFEDSSVNEVRINHVLEHLDNPKAVIIEINRILKDGGSLTVKVPYGQTKMKNPSHLHNFLPEWFTAFEKSNSPYNNKTIGGMFSSLFNMTTGKFRFWKPYEIIVYMQKVEK